MTYEEWVTYHQQICNKLNKEDDEIIVSDFLKLMVKNGESWPGYFLEIENVFNMNPNETFHPRYITFVIVNPRAEACGKTDGCNYGCWRVMGRDKVIKSKETGKILGFKKILKFCIETKPRGYKRIWVMEEYRLVRKQDHVICKIRLLFEKDVCNLLAKHFSCLNISSLDPYYLPCYGVVFFNREAEDAYYLQTVISSDECSWPSYVTNDVYCVDPMTIVDLYDDMFKTWGICFFANMTETSGRTDGGDEGCWRIMERDRLIKSYTGEIRGFKRVFKFIGNGEEDYGYEEMVTFVMEEYRLAKKKMKGKVLCVVKVMFSDWDF